MKSGMKWSEMKSLNHFVQLYLHRAHVNWWNGSFPDVFSDFLKLTERYQSNFRNLVMGRPRFMLLELGVGIWICEEEDGHSLDFLDVSLTRCLMPSPFNSYESLVRKEVYTALLQVFFKADSLLFQSVTPTVRRAPWLKVCLRVVS